MNVAIQTTKHNQVGAVYIAFDMTFFANDDAAFDIQIALNFTVNFDGVFCTDVAFNATTLADKGADVGIADIQVCCFFIVEHDVWMMRDRYVIVT